MIGLPPSPFLNSAPSFPAGAGSAAAVAHAPTPSAAAAPIPDETCFDCGKREPCDEHCPNYSNSDAVVMLAPGSAVIEPCQGAVAAAPISRVTHNPVTQAVEVRPVPVSDGVPFPSLAAPEMESAATPALTPSESTDCIGEIFHFARKLLEEEEDIRRAEDFINWDELEAALEEELPTFIRDGAHLRRWA